MSKINDDKDVPPALSGVIEPMRVVIKQQFTPGKSVNFGVLTKSVDKSKVPDETTRIELKNQATKKLENIDNSEKSRRLLAGQIGVAFTALLYTSMIYYEVSFPSRLLGLIFPIFLSAGFIKSAQSGLWNIAQEGLWDVDGSGLQKIEDASIAQAILDKVNSMNSATGVQAAVITLALALIPFIWQK